MVTLIETPPQPNSKGYSGVDVSVKSVLSCRIPHVVSDKEVLIAYDIFT